MMNSQNYRAEILQNRFALKTTAYLSSASADLPHDITERLRAARAQAVAKRKIASLQIAGVVNASGGSASMTWGNDSMGLWGWAGSFMPLLVLVVGLLFIDNYQSQSRMIEIAEVDSALLVDDLPPAAFSDPGFLQYLKATR